MVDWRRLSRRLGVALNLRDPPNVPPYGWSYFDHLVAVYVNLNSADVRADTVILKSRERPDDLTWGDVFLLESLVFALQPPEVIERSAWILRERFREISCASFFGRYTSSTIPHDCDTDQKRSLLKADLTRILDILHWYYSLIPIRERIRKSLTVTCIVLVCVYTSVLAFILMWCRWHSYSYLAVLVLVVYSGVIGGFVSSQRRMQGLPTDGDPLISIFGLDNAGYYLWLSPLLGAIFAVVLMMMFVGGMLKGAIFPEFLHVVASRPGLSFFDTVWGTLPVDSENYGKLLVWSFLAGFAERLVPDSLDRLSSKLDTHQQLSTPAQPADNSTGTPPKTIIQPDPQHPKHEITEATLQNVMHSGEVSPHGPTQPHVSAPTSNPNPAPKPGEPG